MEKIVFDTNILIDYLNGVEKARKELSKPGKKIISLITAIELLVGAENVDEQEGVEAFLAHFDKSAVDQVVADLAVIVRKEYRLKIPDAIIYATALSQEATLLTRNTKDFQKKMPFVAIPYTL